MKIEFWLAFLLYFATLLAIGMYVRKKKPTAADMMMGSRGLNFWVTALSAQAGDMSSWLFMGFPTSLYLGGFPKIWIAASCLLGMFANWHFIAPKLRRETELYDAYTLSTYFSKRYQDTSGVIRVLSSVMLLIFLTYYLAAGMISVGILFETLFQFDYLVGITIATTVMIGYTFIGGFVSVAWVDLFQAIFLLIAVLIVPVMAFFTISTSHFTGFDTIFQAAKSANIPMNIIPNSAKDFFEGLFGWGLGYFGMPHIITKFMGIRDPKELSKSKYLGLSWQVLALLGASAVGLIGIPFFQNGHTLNDPQLVFVQMVDILFHPFTAGLVLCGVLAATISTMDSQILVAASTVTEDLYKQLVRKNASSKQEVVIFRSAVILISAVAFWIATSRSQTIMDTVYFAWAGLGCTFAPIVVASLYFKQITRNGAIAGIAFGGLFAIVWPLLKISGVTDLYLIPGFILGFGVILTVSFFENQKKYL
ncbi:MAG: ycgO [Chlamydiia bacterium]|nr:ycgO [Chlamydiia bacterium]